MSITAAGIFSGTPTKAGDYKFTLTVTDALGATANAAQDQWVGGGSTGSPSPGSSGDPSGGGATSTPPLPPPPATFALTVTGGTGSGNFAAGATATLTANAPAAGFAFVQWTGAAVANPTAASTTLVMPAAATATFAALPPPPPPTPPSDPSNPILFVTQIPIGFDFTTVGSVFGNHGPAPDAAGRGGDLCIRYPDGTLRNLTAAAGYGVASGFQGANSIEVRDPSVH